MFKFNFSDEPLEKVSSTNSKLDWDEAKELLFPLKNCKDDIDLATVRIVEFGKISVNILKREVALAAIEEDKSSAHATLQAENSHSDLLPAKYEGGLKVWECSEDIGHYLINQLGEKELKDKDVLDLGCGSGLVGIVALLFGANSVTFQDYNQEVLTHWTFSNVLLNSSNENIVKNCKFWSGDWESFSEKCLNKFDLILTSETIYNPDNYGKLHRFLIDHMKPNSKVYLAAKSVYFSLGGSVQLFLSYINKEREDFIYKYVFKSDEGVQRVIIELMLKSC